MEKLCGPYTGIPEIFTPSLPSSDIVIAMQTIHSVNPFKNMSS